MVQNLKGMKQHKVWSLPSSHPTSQPPFWLSCRCRFRFSRTSFERRSLHIKNRSVYKLFKQTLTQCCTFIHSYILKIFSSAHLRPLPLQVHTFHCMNGTTASLPLTDKHFNRVQLFLKQASCMGKCIHLSDIFLVVDLLGQRISIF